MLNLRDTRTHLLIIAACALFIGLVAGYVVTRPPVAVRVPAPVVATQAVLPSSAAATPARRIDPAAYVSDLESAAIVPTYGSPADALQLGRTVCAGLAMGQSADAVARSMTALPAMVADKVVASAKYWLCLD